MLLAPYIMYYVCLCQHCWTFLCKHLHFICMKTSHSSPVTPQPVFQSHAVYSRGPCLDPWVLSPKLTTSQPWPTGTTSILTCTQTTHSSSTAAHSPTPSPCKTAWLAVSLKSPSGARRADCSWTTTKLRWSGLARVPIWPNCNASTCRCKSVRKKSIPNPHILLLG